MQDIHLPLHSSKLFAVYQVLRVVVGLFLLGLQLTSGLHSVLGSESYTTFVWTTVTYTAAGVLTIVIWPPEKFRLSQNLIIGSLLFDISTMLILLHASGGVSSGLGYLIIVYIAIASIFVHGRIGYAFAALATMVTIGDSVYGTITNSANDKDLFATGVLGAVLFATTVAFQFLTEKIRASDLEAATHSAHAEQLQKLAQAIITRMRTGVIVLDSSGKIELINDSALQLMDLPHSPSYRQTQLDEISSLTHLVGEWLASSDTKPSKIHTLDSGQQVRLSAATIQLGSAQRTVLYIEDNRALTQQAQQLKLASLGRLTASIAHEIRNPLGAISHASQLLKESENVADEDKRLVDIVLNHSERVNQIIENTLSISRRKDHHPSSVDLAEWLPEFKKTYEQGSNVHINLLIESHPLLVRVDTSHLSQVLTNLCDNGARYNAIATSENEVTLLANTNNNSGTAFVEVIDRGPGIPAEQLDDIFNPFFTTDAQGTGLGLYICKELCEINQANLFLKPTTRGTTCLHIDFSHYQRVN